MLCCGAIGVTFSTPDCHGDELIKITVKGTSIDLVPETVSIITVRPETQARSLAIKIGKKIPPKERVDESPRLGIRSAVVTDDDRGTVYFFMEPKTLNEKVRGHAFEDGDIVYSFSVDSAEKRKAFIKQYKLIEHAKMIWPNARLPRVLYRASPGHYVLVNLDFFYGCPFHKAIAQNEPGECPMCSLRLVKLRPMGNVKGDDEDAKEEE
jgi:hypothetical protein